ncbi:RHS repeat domain-containing protein [Nocardiopsis halophila]|uniref:hypothetical protein n=1 Tax=Nocardiopsis halophila TaxID=141692 RepID=UPI00034948A7|nr:hypothetical protein [Nocardiopsis halophila]
MRVQQDASLPGHTTDLQIRTTPDGPQGNGVAAGTRIDPTGDGGTTYTNTRYDADHRPVHTSTATGNPDGSVSAGETTASPDGTIAHPDFTLNPDGTLSVPDGQGGTHEYGADGTPQRTVHPDGSVSVPDGQGGALHYDANGSPTPETHPAPPPLGAGPDGSAVFTAPDGTLVRPGDGAMSPDGWILRPTGDGVSLTAPPNRSGDTLTVTHGADGSLALDSGGFHAEGTPDGTSASTPDGLHVGQNDNGRHAGDDHYISTVSPDGHAATHDAADPHGRPVAEHADGQGTTHLPDGTSVHDDGGPGRVEVPPGQRASFADGETSISVAESGTTTVRGGPPNQDGVPHAGGDPWSVSGGRDGTVNGHTPNSDITSHPDGRVEFSNGGFSGTVDGDGTTVTDGTDGMEYRPTPDGVEVSSGADGASVHIGRDGSSISQPGEDAPHNVVYDGDGRPATVEVRPNGPTSLDLHADGHVDVNGPQGGTPRGETTRIEGGSFETTGDRSQVVADGNTTRIENTPVVGNGSSITHGGEGDGLVGVDHNGYQHSFNGDGPVSQGPSEGGPRNGPTRPSLERDGTVSTVEQTYALPGGQKEIPGPAMERNTESGVTEVRHDGFSATQSDGSNGGRDVTVRTSEDGPVVTRRDDGSTTVEGDSLRVDRAPEAADESGRRDPSRRNLTIDTTGDGSGPSVTRDADGNITVSEGGEPILTQDRGHGPDGPRNGGSDNVQVQQVGDRTVIEHTSPETGRQTVIEIRPDGRIDVNSGSDHISVNQNGTPTSTFSDGSDHTTKVEEKNDQKVEITDRTTVNGSAQHTQVQVDRTNSVSALDIKPKKTTDANVAESWRMGIDADGQATTVNNRPIDDAPVTLTPDGNLQQGVARQSEHTSWNQDWGAIARGARLEAIKAIFNAGSDVGMKYVYSLMNDDYDFEASNVYTAVAQVATAAPRGMAESAHENSPHLPGSPLGQVAAGQFNEIGHQQMRNNLSEAFQEQFGITDDPAEGGVKTDAENAEENGYSVYVDGEEGAIAPENMKG